MQPFERQAVPAFLGKFESYPKNLYHFQRSLPNPVNNSEFSVDLMHRF